jgi:hypothetical protein
MIATMMAVCPDDEFQKYDLRLMADSAAIVKVKFFSALRTDAYLVAAQNAAIIREHGEYLRLSNHSLMREQFLDERYVTVFREEMENFRLLFREWGKTFDKLEKFDGDEWGLFN